MLGGFVLRPLFLNASEDKNVSYHTGGVSGAELPAEKYPLEERDSFMSVVRGFGLNGFKYFSNVSKPQEVHLQFTVTPTNGLGITSLKSNGYVRNVFMHTSTTPSANDGYTNPNPASGFALVQFNNNFNYYLNGYSQFISPSTGSIKIDNSALTAGQAYIITTLGDSTLAQWQAVGLPPGITPAVGVSFIATAVGAGANTSTSRVSTPTSSGIYSVEQVGNPGVMLSSSNVSSNGGAWMLLQFMAPTLTMGAYTPAGTVSAPTFTGTPAVLTGTNSAPALTMNSYTPAGTNNGDTPPLFTGTPATLTGTVAAPVLTMNSYTPAGTNSAPTFTGSAASLSGTLALGVSAPATGSVVCMRFIYDGSSVTIDGI